MEKKNYIVEAKCGHVGRKNYTIKCFPTKAKSPSEAAAKTRMFGRVKHNWKDAIVSVREVSEEEYRAQVIANNNDPYFAARCIQDQRAACTDLEIFCRNFREKPTSHKEIRHFHEKRERQESRDVCRLIRECKDMVAYAY